MRPTSALPPSEHGNALTAALNWRPQPWLRVTGEVADLEALRAEFFDLSQALNIDIALQEDTLPDELEVLARAEDGEVMAVGHKDFHVYGLQFHPESILTPLGETIIKNFLEVK